MLEIWLTNSETLLDTIQERTPIDLTLQTISDLTDVTFSVISGKLPAGIRLDGNRLVGTAFEVPRPTTSTWVIRATLTKTITGYQNGNLVMPNHGLDTDVDGTSFRFKSNDQRFTDLSQEIIYYARYVSANEISLHLSKNDALLGINKVTVLYNIPSAVTHQIIFVSDRAYAITIEGYDEPEWITPAGNIIVNPNDRSLFVIDGTLVDFQLQVVDDDLRAGETLKFFIQDDDGQLPLGLKLTDQGQIYGIVDPILSLDADVGEAYYDTTLFDYIGFDPGITAKTGLDTFLYDSFTYDYFDRIRTPRKLNRFYKFRVSVSDGETIIKREFKIYVVGDDFLRADNAIMQVGTGLFTADNTYFRGVVWLTPENLGVKRANNYITIFLETHDPNPILGPVWYQIDETNPGIYKFKNNGAIVYNGKYEISGIFPINPITKITATNPNQWEVIVPETESIVPPGLLIDETNGELFGYIPFQPAASRTYRFTITAIKYDREAITETEIIISMFKTAPMGQRYIEVYPLLNQSEIDSLINSSIRIGNNNYQITSYEAPNTQHPINAIIHLNQPLTITVPRTDSLNNPTEIRKQFITSTQTLNTVYTPKTFVIGVLGESDSAIKFISPENLGTVMANIPSTFFVDAETTVPNAVLSYRLVSGTLPPGLELTITGEIIGKVRQEANDQGPGLTTFDNNNIIFDGKTTTFDHEYYFTILTYDQYRYSATTKEFKITVIDPKQKLYSNISIKPLQKLEKRRKFYEFITNPEIFEPSKIYRLTDPNFGIQKDLKMLLYAGIETSEISSYITAIKTNTKRKRFKIGEIKTAIATAPHSNDILYEVVYLEIIDDYENENGSAVASIKLSVKTDANLLINQSNTNIVNWPWWQMSVDRFRPISIDLTSVRISGQDYEIVYPTSIINMRNNIKNIRIDNDITITGLDTENEFLPRWMTTPQTATTGALGYVKAVPLCYCKPGESKGIVENIQNSDFDFSFIDYDIDRWIIDSTTGHTTDQYLKFPDYKYNI